MSSPPNKSSGTITVDQAADMVLSAEMERIKKMNRIELSSAMQSDVSNVRASIACLLATSADITTMSNDAVTVNSKLKKCAQSLLAKMDEEVEQLSISQVILKSPSLNGKSATKPASPKSLFSSATHISASKIDCMQECKFHHQEKGKSLECGMCANQFHRLCVDVKATARPTCWICPSCKTIPKYLMELKEIFSDLQKVKIIIVLKSLFGT